MDWIKLLPGMDVAYTRKANAITRLDDEIRELEDALKAVMEKKDKLEKELIADIKTSFTNEEIMKAIADSEIYLYK